MDENENVTNEEYKPVTGDYDPSEEETGKDTEELPMAQKKKAVNVQDLVYVRQYIDKKMKEEVPAEVNKAVEEGYYNKEEIDNTFYKKTDTVANATEAAHATNADTATNAGHATTSDEATYAENAGHADNADNSTKVNGYEVNINDNGVLTIGGVIVPQKQELSFTVDKTESDSHVTVTFDNDIADGDKIEFIISSPNARGIISRKTSVITLATREDAEHVEGVDDSFEIHMTAMAGILPEAVASVVDSIPQSISYCVLKCDSYNSLKVFTLRLAEYSCKANDNKMSVISRSNTRYNIEKIYKVFD